MAKAESLQTSRKFKKTLIGEIPVDWALVKLGEVCEVIGGSTPSTRKKDYWSGNISWAVPTDITSLRGNIISKTKRTITEEGLKHCGAKLLPEGSLLLTSRATIGECAVNSSPMATNQGFANLVCSNNIYNWYLFHQVRFIKRHLERFANGSTFQEISKKNIKNFEIPLPPFAEQQKIAEILSVVDSAIETMDGIIQKTETLKKGLMQHLLSGGIGHTALIKIKAGVSPESWAGLESSEVFKVVIICIDKEIDKAIAIKNNLDSLKSGLMRVLLTGKVRVKTGPYV